MKRTPVFFSLMVLTALACSTVTRAGSSGNSTQTAQALYYKNLATQQASGLNATQQALRVEQTATAQAAVVDIAAAASWDILIDESFDDNHNQWPTEPDYSDLVDMDFAIEDGKYKMNALANEAFIYWAYPEDTVCSDFYVSVEAARSSGQADGNYGVVFRVVDEYNYYVFRVDDSGYYTLELLKDNQWTSLIEWTEASLFNGGKNTIEVLGQGANFTFLLNHRITATYSDTSLSEGAVGVVSGLYDPGDQAVFEFDNFVLRTP